MMINHGMATKTPIAKNYAAEFLVLEKGDGVYLEDVSGKRYLDFGSGIAVNSLGHGRKDLAEAVAAQMGKLVHTSNLYTSRPTLKLAEKLTSLSGFAAVQFGNSGSEANESALKYARLYASRTKGPGHEKFLSFTGSFHGRTFGALAVTPTEKYQAPFRPLVPGAEVCRYNDLRHLEEMLDGSFAAVIVEPVQGEGGLEVLNREFAVALNNLCRRHDVLLIADEVQAGLGRCGHVFASRALGLEPDIITLAKPLAGGLPLSAALLPQKVNDLLHPGDHGTTFGGGPVSCAAGNVAVEILTEETFLEDVREKGAQLADSLKALVSDISFAEGVKGMGLLAGLALDRELCEKRDLLASVMNAAREQGLLILRSGVNVLRIAPPLTISPKELDEGISILREVLQTIEAKINKGEKNS